MFIRKQLAEVIYCLVNRQEKPIGEYLKLLQGVYIKPELADKFFEYIWNGWLCLASPVLSNTGTDRGLPISCFGIDVADSINDIGTKEFRNDAT